MVFIGSSERFRPFEHYIVNSIRRNTQEPVEITFIRPPDYGIPEHGCTGFSNMRFVVPYIAGGSGFAIYLDVDMLVLGDLAELLSYKREGAWVGLQDRSNEVLVIDCSRSIVEIDDLHLRKKVLLGILAKPIPLIPTTWNCEDKVREGMKLLHFTDLKCQPYFHQHPCREAVSILEGYGH